MALALASMVLLLSWSAVGRLGGMPGVVLGLAGGVAAGVAIVRDGERAIAVYLTLLPFLSVLGFLVGSLLGD